MAEQQSLPAIVGFRKLDQERGKERDLAKDHAVKKGEEAAATLRELGFPYVLVPADEKANGARVVKDAPSTVSGFRTNRCTMRARIVDRCRSGAFTPEELKAKGW